MSGEVCHIPCAHVMLQSRNGPYTISPLSVDNQSYFTPVNIIFSQYSHIIYVVVMGTYAMLPHHVARKGYIPVG